MANDPSTRGLEIVTAIMLGLVSVVTALGAWQAAVWTGTAQELARDASDARDVSVNVAVLAAHAQRIDRESIVEAAYLTRIAEGVTDPVETMLTQLRVNAALGSAATSLETAWPEWEATGFDPQSDPMLHPDYLIERHGHHESYAHVSLVASELADHLSAKSGVLAQAALIQAVALFLFGISNVNRSRAVRAGVVALGFVVFLGGLTLAVTAY